MTTDHPDHPDRTPPANTPQSDDGPEVGRRPARRTVLKAATATAAVGAGTGLAQTAAAAPHPAAAATAATETAAPDRFTDFFQHGVASGDPLPHAVVIWTRLTPTRKATPGSEVGPRVSVAWQVATDEEFASVVVEGRQPTSSGRDHTVKIDVTGLKANTTYFYRFGYSDAWSRVGRTHTAPPLGSVPERLRMGVVSCSNWQAGYFSAYRHLAARDDLDVIVHLGDYVYEYAPGQYGYGPDNIDVRKHRPPKEMLALADYRQRHAQYKTDPDLQALHAKFPFITTWDDHEVANDAWKKGAENHQADEGSFKARRARAYRVYDEWMPVRLGDTARINDGTRIYRRFRFGTLAELSMLDLRTYRDQQQPGIDTDYSRTITGPAQRAYLDESLQPYRARWKLIGNPVMISPVTLGGLTREQVQALQDVTGIPENPGADADRDAAGAQGPAGGTPINTDAWDGYVGSRNRVIGAVRKRNTKNVVFLTGDIHSAWACEVPVDEDTYPQKGTIGVEFVCSSVTSNNLDDILGGPTGGIEDTLKQSNKHVKYLDLARHGYSVFDVTPERSQMDWYVIGDRKNPNAGTRWSVSYRTDAGSGTVTRVDAPVT